MAGFLIGTGRGLRKRYRFKRALAMQWKQENRILQDVAAMMRSDSLSPTERQNVISWKEQLQKAQHSKMGTVRPEILQHALSMQQKFSEEADQCRKLEVEKNALIDQLEKKSKELRAEASEAEQRRRSLQEQVDKLDAALKEAVCLRQRLDDALDGMNEKTAKQDERDGVRAEIVRNKRLETELTVAAKERTEAEQRLQAQLDETRVALEKQICECSRLEDELRAFKTMKEEKSAKQRGRGQQCAESEPKKLCRITALGLVSASIVLERFPYATNLHDRASTIALLLAVETISFWHGLNAKVPFPAIKSVRKYCHSAASAKKKLELQAEIQRLERALTHPSARKDAVEGNFDDIIKQTLSRMSPGS
eukprot:5715969-Amphidinium_carterae.1